MVKVQFKNTYENVYGSKEYTYNDYEGAAVGDIVVVNTQNGYAIARVSQVGIVDYDIDTNRLSTIEKVIVTQKEIEDKKRAEYEKRVKLKAFADGVKRNAILKSFSYYAHSKDQIDLLNSLTLEELEKLSKFIV